MAQQQNKPGGQQVATKREFLPMKPRELPYPPEVEREFGVTRAAWTALCASIWPLAETPESVMMALAYCKARGLDPFKRPVHIVPMYHGKLRRMVETVWPGISEVRITAMRTREFAGMDACEFGPDIEHTFTQREEDERTGQTTVRERAMRFPEWAQVTVYRLDAAGERRAWPGPRVYWLESYATASRTDPTPNSMWTKRPRGQLEKCAEAAALRRAFPEESDYTADEMHGQVIDAEPDRAVAAEPTARAADRPKPDAPAPTNVPASAAVAMGERMPGLDGEEQQGDGAGEEQQGGDGQPAGGDFAIYDGDGVEHGGMTAEAFVKRLGELVEAAFPVDRPTIWRNNLDEAKRAHSVGGDEIREALRRAEQVVKGTPAAPKAEKPAEKPEPQKGAPPADLLGGQPG